MIALDLVREQRDFFPEMIGRPSQWAEATYELERLDRIREIEAMERERLRLMNERLVKLLSSIHMRCAPADITTADGRTMRFVPPDPEFYWRELSGKVNGIIDELRTIETEAKP